jgi:hypothetical protein
MPRNLGFSIPNATPRGILVMRAAAVRILRALHAALGRWLAVVDPPSAVLKGNRPKPRARTRKPKRVKQPAVKGRSSSFGPLSERNGVSWFDLESGTLTPPKSADDEDIEQWASAHGLPPVRR